MTDDNGPPDDDRTVFMPSGGGTPPIAPPNSAPPAAPPAGVTSLGTSFAPMAPRLDGDRIGERRTCGTGLAITRHARQ